jgi:glycerophosphoryl diester phosphodiesterase
MNWIYRFLLVFIVTQCPVNAEVLDIAHRGYAAENPESTLQTFRLAHDQGADGIEFDVRQTSDGVLVVTHDVSIPALGNRFVNNITFSDIYLETDIPSLEEVLIFAKQIDQTIWLEIKQSHLYPYIIQNVLGLIVKYDLENNTVIQSFNHQDLNTIRQAKLNIPLLALFTSNFAINKVPAYVSYVGLPMSSQYLNINLVKQIHAANKRVIFWRTDSLSETKQTLRKFIDLGADGFMLDRSLKKIMLP